MNRPFTVFIIDDDEPVRSALEGLLDVLGVRVRTFCSAKAFLESYADDWTGCVFADLRMPGMGGLELLEELRRRKIPLPAVLMTGQGDEDFLPAAHDAGAVAALQKPFSVKRLKSILQHQMSKFSVATTDRRADGG
jgi:FixJ family two-component response regulator